MRSYLHESREILIDLGDATVQRRDRANVSVWPNHHNCTFISHAIVRVALSTNAACSIFIVDQDPARYIKIGEFRFKTRTHLDQCDLSNDGTCRKSNSSLFPLLIAMISNLEFEDSFEAYFAKKISGFCKPFTVDSILSCCKASLRSPVNTRSL